MMQQTPKARKNLSLIYWGAFFILLVIIFLLWFFIFRLQVYTDDAYVEGNQVFITPLRPGFITAIHTDDTYLVKQGQLVVELDKTDSLISLAIAEEELAKAVREVCQLFHQVFVYKEEIGIKSAEVIKTAQDYKHRIDVLDEEAVSKEDFEHAEAALRASYSALLMAHTLYYKSLSFVQGTTIHNHPIVAAASDRLREAWVQLHRCGIYSPVEGLAAQRTIQVGMWANSGTPLLSVIPLDQIWVNANFKETQLKHVRIGQHVKITSDLYGRDIVYNGRIVGLPGGAGNAFSLLPPQNLSGNWIKIVQRLPVRVALDADEIRKHPLRIGLSMRATVNLSDDGKLIPTTTEGSPTYVTKVFEHEELGDHFCINEIIEGNLDPSLKKFLTQSFPYETIDFDPEIKKYFSEIGFPKN